MFKSQLQCRVMIDFTRTDYFIKLLIFGQGIVYVCHTEKCCHLVSKHEASAGRLCSSIHSSGSIVHSYLFLLLRAVA